MEEAGGGYLERERDAVLSLYESLMKSGLVTEEGKVHSSDLVWDVIVYKYCKQIRSFVPELKSEFGLWLSRVFKMPGDPPYLPKELAQLALTDKSSLRKELEKFYKNSHSSPALCKELSEMLAKFINFRLRWMKGRAAYIDRVTCPHCKHRHDGSFHGICDCRYCSD